MCKSGCGSSGWFGTRPSAVMSVSLPFRRLLGTTPMKRRRQGSTIPHWNMRRGLPACGAANNLSFWQRMAEHQTLCPTLWRNFDSRGTKDRSWSIAPEKCYVKFGSNRQPCYESPMKKKGDRKSNLTDMASKTPVILTKNSLWRRPITACHWIFFQTSSEELVSRGSSVNEIFCFCELDHSLRDVLSLLVWNRWIKSVNITRNSESLLKCPAVTLMWQSSESGVAVR